MEISGRALHFVFRVAKRGETMNFYRNILGMKVLRHEEFTETCEAACNGPYDNRWSKTMLGYGPEHTHFVIELTYNYGVSKYALGNDFNGITIRSAAIIERAKAANYPFQQQDGRFILRTPEGYPFFILNEPEPTTSDPIVKFGLNVTEIKRSIHYWHEILRMKLLSSTEHSALLTYDAEKQVSLELVQSAVPLNRAETFGRIAFGVPWDKQEEIDAMIKKNKCTILTDLVKLDTPGKATVRVIILADPDGHEICFVDEEGFGQLSELDPESEALLDKYIKKDPFEQKK